MNPQQTQPILHAIARGEYARATAMWNEYAALLREEISRGVCTAAQLAEAGELVRWASEVALCDRARSQTQIDQMWVAGRYGPSEDSGRPTWRASL